MARAIPTRRAVDGVIQIRYGTDLTVEDSGDVAVGPGAFDAQQTGRIPDGAEAGDDVGGSLERLARVRLRMRLPSRQVWRSRMAGLLAWLGMDSMWKDTGESYGNVTGRVSGHRTKIRIQERRYGAKPFDIKRLSAYRPT